MLSPSSAPSPALTTSNDHAVSTDAPLSERVVSPYLCFYLACQEQPEMKFVVTVKGQSYEFCSYMNDAQARMWLRMLKWNQFAISLTNVKEWSDRQRAWAHKMANDAYNGPVGRRYLENAPDFRY